MASEADAVIRCWSHIKMRQEFSTGPLFNEMESRSGNIRACYKAFFKWLSGESLPAIRKKQKEAQEIFRLSGITFISDNSKQEHKKTDLIPFDFVPRIITSAEWSHVDSGIRQRTAAINAFLFDVYHDQEILKEKKIPLELIARNPAFLDKMISLSPPGNIYTHIVGSDIIRTDAKTYYVLEDNARTPSGASYMLENREAMINLFPELFSRIKVKSVQDYTANLFKTLAESAPHKKSKVVVCLLTPGPFNSAYYEHAFLADQMGIELVEGSDLRVRDGRVHVRTINGFTPIDVIYRRIDDDYLDPLNFNSDSLLGVPGLFDVYRAGRISIANAPGTGIADDKSIYSYMPEIIKFYTGEAPILDNVPTWRCSEVESLNYVLNNLDSLVVKEVHGSGGYGMLIGPNSTKLMRKDFSARLKAKPEKYIAQPVLPLSTVPIFGGRGLTPRHVDLRPFSLMSPKGISVTPGGLTRVALKKGSLVVNSSQGGGTKDTWILEG